MRLITASGFEHTNVQIHYAQNTNDMEKIHTHDTLIDNNTWLIATQLDRLPQRRNMSTFAEFQAAGGKGAATVAPPSQSASRADPMDTSAASTVGPPCALSPNDMNVGNTGASSGQVFPPAAPVVSDHAARSAGTSPTIARFCTS
jgi:hypothetical protein